MQLSVAVSVYVLSSKGANQLQVLYIRNLRNIQGNVLHGILPGSGGPQMYSQHFFFFWKYAEVLGQHLKSLFWKIMSYDFFVLFVSYINRNHKDTTHL